MTVKCVIGTYCRDHAFVHGGEAEELRERIAALLSDAERDRRGDECDYTFLRDALWRLLDDVDARDSLAYLEAKPRKIALAKAEGRS